MKCKELKKALEDIDNEKEIEIHIFGQNKNASEFLNLINDSVNNKIIISFVNRENIIK